MTLNPTGFAQKFIDWVSEIPTTNLRIFVSLILAIVFIAVITVGLVFERAMDAVIVGLVFSFLAAMMALDVKQFSVKRNTEIVTPPDTIAQNTSSGSATDDGKDA